MLQGVSHYSKTDAASGGGMASRYPLKVTLSPRFTSRSQQDGQRWDGADAAESDSVRTLFGLRTNG